VPAGRSSPAAAPKEEADPAPVGPPTTAPAGFPGLLREIVDAACRSSEAHPVAVAACFSAGNLKSVAMVLRAKFPTLRLVIAADNDTGTPGNPGERHAFEAAAAAGALVSVPDFEGDR
jgi:phage/plasmid primase-like uncharacterized protein